MSEPFRDELAAVQERLRRKDEEIAELRAAAARLEARLTVTQRPVALVAIAVLLVLVTSFVTFLWLGANAKYHMAQETMLRHEVATCRSILAECSK
jgi:hypothetical protein